jgi:hypothetical protein
LSRIGLRPPIGYDLKQKTKRSAKSEAKPQTFLSYVFAEGLYITYIHRWIAELKKFEGSGQAGTWKSH